MKKGIAVAGNLILDYYKRLKSYPQHSQLTTILSVTQSPGGLACNVGMDLARIDPALPVFIMGILGADEAGDKILSAFSKYPNINVDYVLKKSQTSFTDVMEDTTQKTRTFFQFRGANAEMGGEDFDFKDFQAEILHIGYILLMDRLDEADSEYGTVMARVLSRAQQVGMKTSIDVVSEDSDRFKTLVPPALKYSDYCIINELEASKTVGIPVRSKDGKLQMDMIVKVLERLKEMGVKRWTVIHAREGAVGLDEQNNIAYSPALCLSPDDIKSTTGAGDAFLSGTLYSAWKGCNLQDAIELGIAAAASSLLDASSTEGIMEEEALRRYYNNAKKENWGRLFL